MAGTLLRKLGLSFVAALAVAAVALPAAGAGPISSLLGGGCPTSGSQVFSAWGDTTSYYLAPNGGFESGASGWTLSGASVVSGNQPFFASGSHSLSLPSGSKATSPTVCIGANDLYVRMFVADNGGKDSGLHVRVVWRGLLNTVLGATDFDTFAPGTGWAPSDKVVTAGGFAVPLVPLLGSTSAQIELSPIGAGSNWLVDDLYIDPFAWR